ncbi:SGNH/GDSL hydrolase family protein [Nocardia seriolae]|uniref:Lipase n=1 Tax=Nocardia seriolae TaxID=37332 RepID=A0ABC9YSL6_9NOCA|nr:SGNH/GDSL hydrolase family protein [Nocardia seriolae]APA96467.1 Lipase [Nocardia seriolae]QOW30931.1 SGNH/GDSL hydrolase family protein [Nocardia seriolae]QUN15134.1 SGNH/GDSL hydrolase family protein [Nocardia seriolae]WKY51181.1 SGNH/GDSL hydrolase family protein [Nocardia seriolae]WNJ57870.1 SGNH/GDSL hydrolase family protein [Nocardia seriolae]
MKLKHCLSTIAIVAAGTLVGIAPAGASGTKYVALGDSYAAGIGISNILDTTCSRSDRNYAHLFAAQRGYSLTDVTCGGATTDSVTATQLSAVTSDTALVTLGVGGNDIGFGDIVKDCVMAGTLGTGSGTGSAVLQDLGTGSTSGSAELLLGCKHKYDASMPTRLSQTSAKVAKLVSDIKSRAPQARVVLVGYPHILPDNAALCAGRQPVLPGDVDWARDTVVGGLNTMLRSQAGTEYFSTYEIYNGHDACEAIPDRWVNGTSVDNGEGARFHPNQYGHAATAQQMVATL